MTGLGVNCWQNVQKTWGRDLAEIEGRIECKLMGLGVSGRIAITHNINLTLFHFILL